MSLIVYHRFNNKNLESLSTIAGGHRRMRLT